VSKFPHVLCKRIKYVLTKELVVPTGIRGYTCSTLDTLLSKDGVLRIRSGNLFDGPSGPTLDTRNFMTGAAVHDALYAFCRSGCLPQTMRKDADNLLYDICRDHGMNRFRAWYVKRGVRRFGHRSASREAINIVIVNPSDFKLG